MPVNNDGYLFFLGGSQDAIAIRIELAQEPTEGFPPIAICEHLNVESGRVPVAQERGELHLWSPQVIVVHKTSHEPNDDRTTNCDLVGRSAFSEAEQVAKPLSQRTGHLLRCTAGPSRFRESA